MALPVELERRLWLNIRRLERRHSVEWISPLEQLFIEKGQKRGVKLGLAQGRREGRQEGRQEGRREGAAELLGRQLNRRFGALSPAVQNRLARASEEQLAQWSEAVLDARTLKQVFSSRQ
jgi:flagellar biosynthesis/type III secretory pathway protein FliH